MTKHDPSHAHRHRRERQERTEQRRIDRHIANAGLRNVVRAIGAGDLGDWQDDQQEGQDDE